MSLVADTGGLYALFDADDRHHVEVKKVVERERGIIILPALVLAELDYLLLAHLGVDAELGLLEDIASGAFVLEPLTSEDVARCREILERYRDLKPGLADASVVATCERLGITRVLTLDERDFRVLQPTSGRPFTLLPADDA